MSKQNDEIKDLRAILADERKTKEYIQSYKRKYEFFSVFEVDTHLHSIVPIEYIAMTTVFV